MKTEKTNYRYVVAFASDFVTSDDAEIHGDFSGALTEMVNSDNGDDLTILRAPDGESDYDHVYENGDWVKYC